MNKKNFSPHTHVFLWDLHEVILTKSIWAWFVHFIKFDKKIEIIRNLDKKTIKIALTFLGEVLHITKKQMISEELISAAYQANNHALVEFIIRVCSSYIPIKKTITLMNELSTLGYTHHLGSNIGHTLFEDCKNKFEDIFNQFKVVSIPFNLSSEKIIKKPNPIFFITHAKKCNLQLDQIIFIDDKRTNIIAAQSIGMHAFHFKNAKMLRKKLVAEGIIQK